MLRFCFIISLHHSMHRPTKAVDWCQCCTCGEALPDAPDQGIGCFDPAAELAFACADVLGLHLPDCGTFMDGGQQVDALPFVGTVIASLTVSFFLKLGIAHSGPLLLPVFHCLRRAPVGGGNRIKSVIVAVARTIKWRFLSVAIANRTWKEYNINVHKIDIFMRFADTAFLSVVSWTVL